METIISRLSRLHRIGLLVAAFLFVLFFCASAVHWVTPLGPEAGEKVAPWLLVLAVTLAVALPVLFRTLFVHKLQRATQTPAADFYRLQQGTLLASIAALCLLPFICLIQMPLFYQGGITLAALYGAYYHYPSRRRIAFDYRIFRVRDDEFSSGN